MNLTHDPADILRYTLIGASQGTLPTTNGSWPIYTSQEPNTPDNCITTYNTQGQLQGRIQKSGLYVEKPGIQIRIRATDHTTGHSKAKSIEAALDAVYDDNVTISSNSYEVHAVHRTASIAYLGKDSPSSNRHLFTLNVTVTIRQLT